VANAVALQFALCTPNFLIQEDMIEDVPWRWEVVRHNLRFKDGFWLPCDAPGLGIEVDESAARRHPFEQEMMEATSARAVGAALDW
jgi:galactonate dehydratase